MYQELIEFIGKIIFLLFMSYSSIITGSSQEEIVIETPVSNIEEVKQEEKIELKVEQKEEIFEIPIVEESTSEEKNDDVYVGRLTGYGPDCYGCSGTGYLACHTKNGGTHSLVNDGIYYNDDSYGRVRILSAAKSFPCGTIMKVEKEGYDPYFGIVLDRGGTMNSEWEKGNMFVDLAYEKEALAGSDNLTGYGITFTVIRYGW